ncbi:MAG: hypothetical protein NTZ56_06360 [Acidobacteria bacterium]|nr:hypothetical protein [Acidobacteriota bacterium]
MLPIAVRTTWGATVAAARRAGAAAVTGWSVLGRPTAYVATVGLPAVARREFSTGSPGGPPGGAASNRERMRMVSVAAQAFLSSAEVVSPAEITSVVGWHREDRTRSPILVPRPSEVALYLRRYLTHEGSERRVIAAVGPGQHCYAIGARLPNSPLLARLIRENPLTYVALWGGCMIAGGATSVRYAPDFLAGIGRSETREARIAAIERLDATVDLTVARDPVSLGYFTVTDLPDGSMLITMLARTNYGHALDGSVSHMMLITGSEIRVGWVGAGGSTPIISAHLNNMLAMNTGFGTWSGMIRNMRRVAANQALLEALDGLDAEERRKKITELIWASTSGGRRTFETVLLHLADPLRWASRVGRILRGASSAEGEDLVKKRGPFF